VIELLGVEVFNIAVHFSAPPVISQKLPWGQVTPPLSSFQWLNACWLTYEFQYVWTPGHQRKRSSYV